MESKEFLKRLPFEIELVRGIESVSRIKELQLESGTTPILMGNPDNLGVVLDGFELAEQTAEDIIEESKKVQYPDWFNNRAREDAEYYEIPHGEWPVANVPQMSLTAHLDTLTGKPFEQVAVGLIPVCDSWKVPAYLKFGGWNEFPYPHEQVALLRKWSNEYSADIVSFTGNVIEFKVKNPPANKEQAIELAEEQFIYCADIVLQGVGTLENLAATIIGSDTWYFWWD